NHCLKGAGKRFRRVAGRGLRHCNTSHKKPLTGPGGRVVSESRKRERKHDLPQGAATACYSGNATEEEDAGATQSRHTRTGGASMISDTQVVFRGIDHSPAVEE